MNKFIIIDGSSLISTYFYATVPNEYYRAKTQEEKKFILPRIMQTSTGIFTNGVFAMCKSLIKLVEQQKPSHIAVCWDISRNTFRRQMYPEYKANRAETAPELKSQFILMQEILTIAGIPQFMDENLEADDFIGSLAKQFESELPVFILTKDQDALQLVSNRTRLWLITSKAGDLKKVFGQGYTPDGTFEFTPDLVHGVYGLWPEQIIDKKALEGDASDNIPGVRGVGEKVAVPLLQEYKTVENIYEALIDAVSFKETCKELGVRAPIKALSEGENSAHLSKNLARIKCFPIDISLQGLATNINYAALNEKFRELEFKSLIKISHEEKMPQMQQYALF